MAVSKANETVKNRLRNSNHSGNVQTVRSVQIEKGELATGSGTSKEIQQNKPSGTLWEYINSRKETISKALPKHMTPERMGMIAFTEIRRNPKLLQCTPQSLFGSIMQASQLGVEPGPLGQCYLVPFWNKKTSTYDVQFILGYKGMIDLARRSGNIKSIYAHAVREKDQFEYSYGLNPTLIHKPSLKNRGDVTGFYGVVHFRDGGSQFEFMSIDEVEQRKERSKSSENGPWVTDYEEMGKKTILRHMWKYLPVSVEVMRQTALDETVTDIEKPDIPVSVYDMDSKEEAAA